MGGMILWQRVEGSVVLAAAIAALVTLDPGLPWWALVLTFLAPDLSFAAYLLGPRFGAIGYNLVHIYGFGVAVFAAGLWLGLPALAGIGALWLGHAGFDRMLGYGLKSAEGFGITHLGRIGQRDTA